MNYIITINGKDYTPFVSLPFIEQYALDESLDNGVLVLKNTQIDTIFKPYDKVIITVDSTQQSVYYVAQDEMTKIIGGNYYNHKLTLIEETKLLEKIVVDTNTITQPLQQNFLDASKGVYLTANTEQMLIPTTYSYLYGDFNSIFQYIESDYVTIPAPIDVISHKENSSTDDTLWQIWMGVSQSIDSWSYTVTESETNYTWTQSGTSIDDLSFVNTHPIIMGTSAANIKKDHSYTVNFRAEKTIAGILNFIEKEFQFNVILLEKGIAYSITDVVNRLLNIYETLKVGEMPQLHFNEEQSAKYGGEYTWLLNFGIDVSNDFEYNIPFKSNGNDYSTFKLSGDIDKILTYDNTTVYGKYGIQDYWYDEAYRTVVFKIQPKGNLLEWLKLNAVYQGEELYLAPEFSFTRGTLKECLDQIGGYIHAIPRLENDTIYFDELGQNNEIQLPTNYIGEIQSQNIEQYCTHLDTHADNLVNYSNSKVGTVIEPYYNGYETVRAETGVVRITDETAIIETEYPIGKIAQLKIGYTEDNNGDLVLPIDITPYVYESAEYQALSSYNANYPYAKAYAIYYKQGEKNIYGLNFKMEHAISPIFENYAIINILERITQHDYANLVTVEPFVQLNFQIVYYPIVTARVGQAKPNLLNYDRKITSIYNQSANMIDSTAYGENLKGAVMRLGNIDMKRTYIFPDVSYVAEVGTLIDNDYYISTVDLEYFKGYVKCTYGLSKDFNRLSQYIGIKNNIRMYEISEKQAVDRYILTEDYFVLGDDVADIDNLAIFNGIYVINGIYKEMQGNVSTEYPTCAVCKTDAVNEKFVFPLISLGIGNSLLYTFRFKDNYSAGNVATPGSDNNTFNVQTYIPYGNDLGRFDNINIQFDKHAQIVEDDEPQQDKYPKTIAVGNALPVIDANNGTYQSSKFTNVDLQIYKDNRENLIFNHQVHWVTNWNDLIIGSGFASNSLLVGCQEQAEWKLYILPNKINKFDKYVDLTDATMLSNDMFSDYDFFWDNTNFTKAFFENMPTATTSGKSWAVVRTINSENVLLFGRNIDIIENEEIELPTISFIHKYFN